MATPRTVFLTFTLLFMLCTIIASSEDQSCSEGEVYTTCGSACPRTCGNHKRNNIACAAVCVKGCFCQSGLIRRASDGKCVSSSMC